VIGVVVGAVIGYLTNWLAIKMLFWPLEPKFIFGRQIPLTPGLFVRRRHDFSRALAHMAQEKFADAEDLRRAFYRAHEQGLVVEFIESMGPMVKVAWNMYVRRAGADGFKRDLGTIAKKLGEAEVVENVVRRKMDQMSDVEVRDIVLSVSRRELKAITLVGALLGAAIGLLA